MASILKVDQIQTAAGGTPTAADLGINTTGTVLQVVHQEYTSAGGTTSTSYVDYASLSITPSSTSSKVLAMFCAPLGYQDSGGQNFYHFLTMYRGTTDLGRSNGNGISGTYYNGITYNDIALNTPTIMVLDSPNTANSVTYYLKHKVNTSSASAIMCLDGQARFTLMEIAG